MADESKLIRNSINPQVIKKLGERIQSQFSPFDVNAFKKDATKNLGRLGLMERIDVLTQALEKHLPKDFKKASKVLIQSLPEELPEISQSLEGQGGETLSGLNGFVIVSMTEYIARNGREHFSESMSALYEMTKRFSSEFSIRCFIKDQPSKTLKVLLKWTNDPNMHVRRLCSEGVRPRLPWAIRLTGFVEDPKPILPILEKLKSDPELYVRRSVANNLNDISKDHPELVVTLLKKWSRDKSEEMQWLIRHALRTLVKAGHPKALELLGYSSRPNIRVKSMRLAKTKIKMGESLDLEVELTSSQKKAQALLVDYKIHHMKANGKLSPKVFKWTQKTISSSSPLLLKKRHPFKEISTRRYYLGRHEVELQVNGVVVSKKRFFLVE
jgi:3-methyladenine DNA glycosylase AlkC